MIWAVAVCAVALVASVSVGGSLWFAAKVTTQVAEENRCPELSGNDRCELDAEHDGPHRVNGRWFEDEATRWADNMARKERMRIEFPATVQAEEAAQQALAKQHAEARAKLAWDLQNAAPAMYEQQNIGAQQFGKLFKQG